MDKKIRQVETCRIFWQGQKDLNPRPMVLETSTLPTELYPYIRVTLYQKKFGLSRAFSKKRRGKRKFLRNLLCHKRTSAKFEISRESSLTLQVRACMPTPFSFARISASANSLCISLLGVKYLQSFICIIKNM